MLAQTSRPGVPTVAPLKRQGSIWNPADLPDFNKLSPPLSPVSPKLTTPTKGGTVPNFSKHRISNASHTTDTNYSARTSTSTQGSHRSVNFKDDLTTPITKTVSRESYDNNLSPRSTKFPQTNGLSVNIPERRSSKAIAQHIPAIKKPTPTITFAPPPKKTALKKTSTYASPQTSEPSSPVKKQEVVTAQVATGHRPSIVSQTYKPYGPVEPDLVSALSKANPARKSFAKSGREDSIATVISAGSNGSVGSAAVGSAVGSIEFKVNQLDAKVDLLVPAIEKLTRALELLSGKLDQFPTSRPGTRGDSNTTTATAVSTNGAFTAAWRDHNNGFLGQQQLRRPSQITSVSRRPSTAQTSGTSIPTPRSVAFADVPFNRDSTSPEDNSEHKAIMKEVAEQQEEESSLDDRPRPSLGFRERAMSRWDTETEDDTNDDEEEEESESRDADDDDDLESDLESPYNDTIGSLKPPAVPVAPAPSPVNGPPPVTVPTSLKVTKKLAQRRPTGFPGKKMGLPVIPASPPVSSMPLPSIKKGGSTDKSVMNSPTITFSQTPTKIPQLSHPKEPEKPLPTPISEPEPGLEPEPEPDDFQNQVPDIDPDLISPPGPLAEQPPSEPGAPGLNWAWGWPKQAARGSIGSTSGINSTSKNFPYTATTLNGDHVSFNQAGAHTSHSPTSKEPDHVPSEPTTPKVSVHKANTPKAVTPKTVTPKSVTPQTAAPKTVAHDSTDSYYDRDLAAKQQLFRRMTMAPIAPIAPPAPALPPPRPGWYFFMGRATNPQFLQQLLDLASPPNLQPALVYGHRRRYHPEGGYVAVEAGVTETVHGYAMYVPRSEMAEVLREWWGGTGDVPGVCGEGFVEVGVDIEFENEEGKRGRRLRRWESDEEDGEVSDGCVPGRMFVWRGVEGVLTDEGSMSRGEDGDGEGEEEEEDVTSVEEIVRSYKR